MDKEIPEKTTVNLEKARIYLEMHGKISIPFLQRKLQVGYETAKEIMEELEK